MISRRRALRLAGSTVSLSYLSGCLGLLQDGGIEIRINNRDDQQHTISATFERENETVFSDQYTISPGEEAQTSDVVEAGEYLVTVGLNSSHTRTVDFHMGGCDSNALYVSIDESGEFDAGVLDWC